MKKLLFGMVLALMVVSLFGWALPAVADDDNFEKAGQQALEEREKVLIEGKAWLEQIVLVLAADRVITTDEMIALRNEVKDFNQTKKEFDKYLEFYELKTTTELDKALVEAATDYFARHTFFKRDYNNEAKKLFIEATGKDVVVQKGMVIVDGFNIFLMVLIAFSLFMMIVYALSKEVVGGVVGVVGGVVGFGIVFISLLLVLFLL